MFDLILYTLLLAFLLATIIFYAVRYRDFKGLKDVRGPGVWPIIGNVFDLNGHEKFLKACLGYQNTYGPVFKVSMGFDSFLGVNTPELVSFIMNSTKFIEKGSDYRKLQAWLGTGLLTSTGDKWTQRRKMLTPTFHFKILNSFIPTFETIGDILIEKLHEKADKGTFDIFPLITLYSLDVICETAMGYSTNALINSGSDYAQNVKDILYLISQRTFQLTKRFDITYIFTSDCWSLRRLTKKLHEHTYKVIGERRQLIAGLDDDMEDEFGVRKKIAFLDMLIKSTVDDEPLSDEDIREEVDTFMFEGHDTTSTAIAFGLYALSMHPEVQTKILDEQKQILGDDKAVHATYDDLQKMTYLEMVIKEIMRLYPSVPVITRKCKEDSETSCGIIANGVEIVILPFLMHRCHEYFQNPECFDPERFSPENIHKIKPFSYIPFSGGYRNCIGQKFALLDMKSAFSKIIRNFELHPDANFEPRLSFELILKSLNGLSLEITRRP